MKGTVDRLEELTQRATPVRLYRTPVGGGEQAEGLSLAALVPLILILMTITGAVYPAIDLTAGERERGTLEVLIAAPIPRLGVLFAKYVAVLAVATAGLLYDIVSRGFRWPLDWYEFTVMPALAFSSASALVKPISPALAAE